MSLINRKKKSQYSDSCNKLFKYWRMRTMYSIFIGYASFYLIRQNFSLAIPSICNDLNITKSDIGIIISIGSILYGVGKGFFGLIGDRYGARHVMAIGLAVSAFMNIFLGFSSAIPAFTVFYALSWCFQSMGWPPCAKLLTHWFSPIEIGTKWALWNASQQVGGSVVAFLAPVILVYCGWRYLFFIPGLAAILLAAFLFNRLRDTPESLKLPSVEKITGLASVAKETKWNLEETKMSYGEIIKMALNNKFVWYVGLANFFVYICRMTFMNWGPAFLLEAKGSALTSVGIQMAFFDLAGIFGGVFAGYLSDKMFKGRRGPVSALCMLVFVVLVFFLWLTPKNSPIISSLCMICIGFIMTGPQILVGVAAADFASKKAAATASGFTGTLGYAGSAVSGAGAGFIADHYGWSSVCFMVIVSAVLSSIFFVLTWNKKSEVLNSAEKYGK